MDSYSKMIPIKFVVDDDSLEKAELQIDSLIKDIKISIGSFNKEMFTSARTKTEAIILEPEIMSASSNETQVPKSASTKEKSFEPVPAKEESKVITKVDSSLSKKMMTNDKSFEPVKFDKKEKEDRPVSFDDLFTKQFESYKELNRLKSESTEESKTQLEAEQAIYSSLVEQTNQLGVDGQLSLLDKKLDILDDINEYSKLDTKEAKEKIKVLKEQLSYLSKTYKIESDVDKKQKKKQESQQQTKAGLQSIDETLTGGKVGSSIKTLTSFKTSFLSGLALTGALFIKSLKDVVEDAERAAKELYQSSKISNAETRETMFHWGVDNSDAQSINQANEIFNFDSDEDMFYGFQENPEVQKKYFTTVTRFAEKYTQLQEAGTFEKMLDYQIEMAELEFDLQQEQAKFYMENIDEIKAIKKFTMDIQIMFTKIFGWLARMFNNEYASQDASKAAEILNENTIVNNANKSTNVSIDNSFNNQGVTDKISLESTLTSLLNVVEASLT